MHPTRRQVLGTLAAAGAATLVDPGNVLAKLAADVPCTAATPAGELLGTLPLFRYRTQNQAFGVKYGGPGLDARMVTDLSLLEPGKLITANELAYIRTEIPAAAAAHTGPWTIETSGLLAKDGTLALDAVAKQSKNMGPQLFECSGNANPSNFGLMSVAEWEGIPLTGIVDGLKPTKDATGVLVSGFDHIGQVSQRSIVGASWVFPLASLDKLGAYLAVRMNGEPLPADHGKPVRLVVPGWYGCTWIKWVNEIRLVGPDEPATTQMV
ncbi:MAG: molybdopterin-dependent oxidoreductase, partial [Vicinamibacterales bacterium]